MTPCYKRLQPSLDKHLKLLVAYSDPVEGDRLTADLFSYHDPKSDLPNYAFDLRYFN